MSVGDLRETRRNLLGRIGLPVSMAWKETHPECTEQNERGGGADAVSVGAGEVDEGGDGEGPEGEAMVKIAEPTAYTVA